MNFFGNQPRSLNSDSNLAFGFRKLADTLCRVFLCLTGFLVAATPAYMMPKAGLDESWTWGLNQALAQGLTFGRDVIFNVGPYLSVFTQRYHPAVDILSINAHIYFGICYAIVLMIATRRSPSIVVLVALLLVAVIFHERDVLIVFYPLLAGIAVLKILEERRTAAFSGVDRALLLILFSVEGLLPLVKGSFLIAALVSSVLSSAVLYHQHHRRLAVASLVLPLLVMLALWGAAGQDFSALPQYFVSIFSVISGYAEAMQLPGSYVEIALYVVVALAILWTIVATTKVTMPFRAFLFLLFGAYLFLMFKEGFIRDGGGHTLAAGQAIFGAVVALGMICINRAVMLITPVALFMTIYVHEGHGGTWRDLAYGYFLDSYATAGRGFTDRVFAPAYLPRAYRDSVDQVREALPIPPLPGTTDIYSYGQAPLLASNNTWAPRPVIQGHEAYTPYLEHLNLAYLNGPTAPDNIVFKVETIDDRMPALEDGMSWPAIMTNYVPQGFDRSYLFLRKSGETKLPPLRHLATFDYVVGRDYSLRRSSFPLYARIEIHPTMLGRLVQLLFKPAQLLISLRLSDGSSRTYRIPSGLAASGFLISPVIENTGQLALLMADRTYLESREVTSVHIDTTSFGRHLWSANYRMELSSFDIKPTVPARTKLLSFVFAPLVSEDAVNPGGKGHVMAQCAGSIDSINGNAPRQQVVIDRTLAIAGWDVVSGEDGKLPAKALINFTDEHGTTLYAAAGGTARSDVAEFFRHPELSDAGFTAFVDTSRFGGSITVGVARINNGRLEICENLQQRLIFNNH